MLYSFVHLSIVLQAFYKFFFSCFIACSFLFVWMCSKEYLEEFHLLLSDFILPFFLVQYVCIPALWYGANHLVIFVHVSVMVTFLILFQSGLIRYCLYAMYGYVWKFMIIYDYLWLDMTIYDYVWLCTGCSLGTVKINMLMREP